MSISKLPSGKYQVIWREPGPNGKLIKRKSTKNEHGVPFRTMTEARIFHDEKINDVRKARLRKEVSQFPSHRSIHDAIEYYKSGKAYKDLRDSSKHRYEKVFRILIKWCENNRVYTLKDMTREKVRDFEVYLYENYSKKGIGYIITLCSSIFAEELRRDNTVLSKNYFAALTRPKVERQKIRIFSNSELKFIFVNTKSIELRSVFIILLYTGMRPSELINLKYSNISRDHITIVNSKTFKGNRTIPLTSKAREAVKTLSTLTKGKEYLLNGDKPYPDKVLTNRFARKKQYWIKRMPSLSDTSLYDFRHTYGSLLLQAGVNIAVIADLLGHEDIRTTQRWYARLTDADIKEGVMKLEKQFGGLSGDK